MYYDNMNNIISDEFYKKYFKALDRFNETLSRYDGKTLDFGMYHAAKTLSDTPLSAEFFEVVKGVNANEIHPEFSIAAKRQFLKEEAGFALMHCSQWHFPDIENSL